MATASSLRLDLGQRCCIVVRNFRFILSIRVRESSEKIERGSGGLELCFDRVERLLPLIVGWSRDGWGIGVSEGAELAV